MIRGITFRWQEVRPEDDGRLYAAMLYDGVIHGCAVSAAGYTLTLSPGFIVAAGRLIKVTAAQNYACSGASEGYARLVLSIDLTAEASVDTFEQIQGAIQYAADEASFPALTQQDINDGVSTLYQLEIARVALGDSGITQIISSLPAAAYKEGKT